MLQACDVLDDEGREGSARQIGSPTGKQQASQPAQTGRPAPAPDRASYLGPTGRPPQPVELHSQFVGEAPSVTVAVGQTAELSVQFKNTGIAHWVKGAPSEIHLGVSGDSKAFADMAVDWLTPTRPAAQTEPEVLPDAVATFTFTVKGAKAGTYKIPVRLVCEGVAWLDDDGVFVTVTVR